MASAWSAADDNYSFEACTERPGKCFNLIYIYNSESNPPDSGGREKAAWSLFYTLWYKMDGVNHSYLSALLQ